MNISRASLAFIACWTALLTGCGASDTEETGGDDTVVPVHRTGGSGNQEPPSGSNGILPSCFWAHGSQHALRTLGNAALDQGGGSLSSISLSLVPAGCRHVIAGAVECALPPGESLTDPETDDHYEGWWGLAPSWQSGALDTDGRRNVTACMIQRLNASGTPVPILLEGPNSAIVHDADYDSLYSIEESTAFGDLFSSTVPLFTGLPAFNTFICWEDLLPQSCGLLGLPLLEERICDDLILCGVTAIGPCSLSCAQNGSYWKCKPGLLSPYWTQTIRVKLATETCN